MLELIRFVLSALFTLAGLFVLVSGVVGVFRFRYSMNRGIRWEFCACSWA